MYLIGRGCLSGLLFVCVLCYAKPRWCMLTRGRSHHLDGLVSAVCDRRAGTQVLPRLACVYRRSL